MLNLCLKRMCARVITSLSALGVVSIAGTTGVEAANYSSSTVYKNGDSFSYTPTKGLTFTAQYSKKNGSCSAGSNFGVGNGIYSANTANTKGTCSFNCKAGMFYSSGLPNGGTEWIGGFSVTGNAGTTISAGTGECLYVKPGCPTVANATVVSTGGGKELGYCNYKCNAGYHVDGVGQTVTGFSEVGTGMTSPNMSVTPSKSCVANTYTVTFDCTSSGTISGTSSQTTTKSAKYGESFKIDKACEPKTTAWTFSGWKGN